MRQSWRLPAVGGTLVFTVFLVVVLGLAVQGAFVTRVQISRTFHRQARLEQAQIQLEELRRLQIDEENAVRGFTITRDSFYRQQYLVAVADFGRRLAEIRTALQSEHLTGAIERLRWYQLAQRAWRAEVAVPLLDYPNLPFPETAKRSKFYADYEARIADEIRTILATRSAYLARSTQEQINRTLYVRAFWLLLFGVLAILFNAYRSRTSRELEEERSITQVLQRAFRSEHVPLPNSDVGSAYAAASSHLAVGGDVFDVYRLSESLALILIADVSGKGVDAAVLTAFIKFTMRGIALRRRDPGAMLSEFNGAFAYTVSNPYLFVSMFVGILDTERLSLRYASAGHDSAFIRRADGVEQLEVTGPILGVMEEQFESRVLQLADGDVIVLATDGLTEARDRHGDMLEGKGAMDLIAQANPQPQRLADELAARVRAVAGNRMRDDLAILAIRVHAKGTAQ
ncbi:MAG: PP2C family protein-serine/threonine phosphatase [Vulcanimicrobiaceae bacterium]